MSNILWMPLYVAVSSPLCTQWCWFSLAKKDFIACKLPVRRVALHCNHFLVIYSPILWVHSKSWRLRNPSINHSPLDSYITLYKKKIGPEFMILNWWNIGIRYAKKEWPVWPLLMENRSSKCWGKSRKMVKFWFC